MTKKKPKSQRAARTRNANTMTEAEYWGKIRSALRKAFAYWKPAQEAVKQAECGTRTNPETGRQKKVYLCAVCGNADFREEMHIDHIDPCGSLRTADDVAPFLDRLTCEDPFKFQLLHKTCHQAKTNEGRK
jgi:5-methylcytosine-specific restriction endonuclease McrA